MAALSTTDSEKPWGDHHPPPPARARDNLHLAASALLNFFAYYIQRAKVIVRMACCRALHGCCLRFLILSADPPVFPIIVYPAHLTTRPCSSHNQSPRPPPLHFTISKQRPNCRYPTLVPTPIPMTYTPKPLLAPWKPTPARIRPPLILLPLSSRPMSLPVPTLARPLSTPGIPTLTRPLISPGAMIFARPPTLPGPLTRARTQLLHPSRPLSFVQQQPHPICQSLFSV